MDKIKLYNGDCLEAIQEVPDNSVDLVITDPPYNISRKTGFNSSQGYRGMDFGEWDKGFDLTSYIYIGYQEY